MKHPLYVQIFTITDHAQALHGRYQGSYQGMNAELQTTEFANGIARISKNAKVQNENISKDYFENAQIILAYRHSDTGVLKGTSESIFSISQTPWEEMPGLIFDSIEDKDVVVNMWSQEMKLQKGLLYRIHFGKTIVYMKNFGPTEKIEFTDKLLSFGASALHSENVDHNISLAPEPGSDIQVKMGQETQN